MDVQAREDRLYGTLFDLLLNIGGETVGVPDDEPDLAKIVRRGYARSGSDAEFLEGGRPVQCHGNAAFAWKDNPETLGIVTGYALSADGHWRQHSWLRDLEDGRLYETTEPRMAYFGFDLTPEESERFYDANAHV